MHPCLGFPYYGSGKQFLTPAGLAVLTHLRLGPEGVIQDMGLLWFEYVPQTSGVGNLVPKSLCLLEVGSLGGDCGYKRSFGWGPHDGTSGFVRKGRKT